MISRYKPLFLSLSFLTLYALTIVFAVPPLTQYTPGETLDPSCAPGDTNCSVLLSSGWGITGNAGTTAGTNFIGTTDDVDVVIKRNSAQVARFYGDRLSVGIGAGNSVSSNFFGLNAGNGATNATNSNFFGQNAGRDATSAGNSNFFGFNAGQNATNATNSNFFGTNAGRDATNSRFSNFLGVFAGNGATDAYNSNFFGERAGQSATNAAYSNFFGYYAGQNATNANYSNFFGEQAGRDATNATNSNFFGFNAGRDASNATYSNLLGFNVGRTFADNNIGSNNIIIGTNISLPDGTENAINIGGVLFGTNAYSLITLEDPSIFPTTAGRIGIGVVSPAATLDINGDTIISGSSRYFNFGTTSGSSGYGFRDNAGTLEWKNNTGSWTAFGGGSGWSLTGNAGTDPSTNFIGTTDDVDVVIRRNNVEIGRLFSDRLFFGAEAGVFATNANNSNFFGNNAGHFATNANNSNFFGQFAGYGSSGASKSNFFGQFAGNGATNATYSNFFGADAGSATANASYSNFFGQNAGVFATNATYSNFFGAGTGNGASNASYSNLFGFNVGRQFTGNNIDSNNIIIGTNISLPNATANAINLGGVLFGTNTYATTTGNPSIVPVNTGRIGIATNTLNYTFQAGNNTISGIVARFENSTGTCDINPTTTSLVCSSDQTLKSNIQTLPSVLSQLSQLRPVTYSWTSDSSRTPQIGFIAQEVEHVFPNLVFTDPTTGLKSLAYTNLIPYTISALQDINLSLTTLDDTQKPNVVRDVLKNWFASATNGITKLFVGEVETRQICVSDETGAKTCLTKSQLDNLLVGQSHSTTTSTKSNTGSLDIEATEITDQNGKQEDRVLLEPLSEPIPPEPARGDDTSGDGTVD